MKRIALAAFALSGGRTLLSAYVPGRVAAHYAEIMGCEHACEVAAAGWPVPFLVDDPGLSPAGAASLSDALLGMDRLRWPALLGSWAFWLAVGAGVAATGRRARARWSVRKGNRHT